MRLPCFGPLLPMAFCRCGTRLEFETAVFRGTVTRSTGWRCHCTGCIDGETFSDGSHSTHVVVGEGESPWAALEDLAAVHFDCGPEDLLWTEPEVIPPVLPCSVCLRDHGMEIIHPCE